MTMIKKKCEEASSYTGTEVVGKEICGKGLMLSPDRPVHLTRQARKDRNQNVLCHDSAVTQYITQTMDTLL